MNYNIDFVENPIVDILIAVAEKGGVENCVNMLGKYLLGKKIKVRVVQLVYEGYSWADERLEFHYVYDSRLGSTVGKFVEGYKNKISEIGAPNLVIATAWPTMSYVAKTVAEQLGADYLVASWLHAPLSRYDTAGFGGKDMLEAADFHLAISDEIANEIKIIPEAKIYRVYNPVDFSKIRKTLDHTKGQLLYVGRISAEKNIQFILRALATAKTKWSLKLVGDGDDRENLEKLAKKLGISDRVSFTGWSDDPWKYANGSYALIMSSLYEGFPLVAIEALSCGLPVIANEASGVGEIVQTGQSGYIYKNNDIHGLAKLLDRLYLDGDNDDRAEICMVTAASYAYETAAFDFYLKTFAAINGRLVTDRLYSNTEHSLIDDKISVIVPCYNVEKYVGRCLDSILNQSIGIERLEIILVNDCSTDGTINLLMDYEKEYSEAICVVDCQENGGQGKARNIGLNYATGKYVTFVDSDDCIDQNMLLYMYCIAVCYPVDLIKCDFEMFSDTEEIKDGGKLGPSKLMLIEGTKERKEVFLENAFINCPWGKLIKSSLFQDGNLFFPEGVRMEDIFFTYQLISKIHSYVFAAFKGYNYYQNSNGVMRSDSLKDYYMDVFYVFRAVIEEYKTSDMFENLTNELIFVFYKKVFLDLFRYMENTFEELPIDNARILIEYANEVFPDYKENVYLSNEDKNNIELLRSKNSV